MAINRTEPSCAYHPFAFTDLNVSILFCLPVLLRQPEVNQKQSVSVILLVSNQDVIWFYISMQEQVRMQVF
jgi:hypothetical protein